MRLSVIVPTCNERDELAACLDTVTAETPDVETIVINGPSSDGTSGMVRSRDDVEILLECSSRNLNVARNAGLKAASGDAFALLAPSYRIQPDWYAAIVESLEGSADLVTGPVELVDEDDAPREFAPTDRLRVRGGNLALTREAVTALDGFDEYLITGGANDLGQRVAGQNLHVTWHPEMRVRHEIHDSAAHRRQHRGGYGNAWQGLESTDWGGMYRSLAYRTVKNDGPRPGALLKLFGAAARDAFMTGRDVLDGQVTPSGWASTGVSVVRNSIRGGIDGFRARRDDGTPARNPSGLSRSEAAVVVDRYEDS